MKRSFRYLFGYFETQVTAGMNSIYIGVSTTGLIF